MGDKKVALIHTKHTATTAHRSISIKFFCQNAKNIYAIMKKEHYKFDKYTLYKSSKIPEMPESCYNLSEKNFLCLIYSMICKYMLISGALL